MLEFSDCDNWENDKLDRREDANYLSDYLISKHEQGSSSLTCGSFVLNVNAEWGYGKTYFLENWANDLSEKGHPVVYFDSWKNDYSKDPLLAFISTINEQLSPYFDKKIGARKGTKVKNLLSDWFTSGKKLAAPSTPVIMAILAKRLSGFSMDELSELLEERQDQEECEEVKGENDEAADLLTGVKKDVENTVSTVVSKAASKMMESHQSKKRTINDFKTNLSKLTKHLSTLKTIDLPVFIFVDELDRCRPDYAIEVLENIKHLFGVPGVFFVVATASEQLGHSIKAIYGESFDSASYLKRFFDQTYTMKQPDRLAFSKYLFSKFGLNERDILYMPNIIEGGKSLSAVDGFSSICSLFECGLRDMVQYCVVVDSISLVFKEEKIHLVYLMFLIVLREKNHDSYKAHRSGEKLDYSNLHLDSAVYNRKYGAGVYNNPDNQISFGDLITKYLDWSGRGLRYINHSDPENSVYHCIQRVLLENSWDARAGNGKNSLNLYPLLIEQAGRIS